MPKQLFEDTRTCNASFFLDENGHEITKHEFVYQLKEWAGLMLYIGGGFVPMPVAVLTLDGARQRHVDEGSAVEAMEEWARRTGRKDQIGEDDEWQARVQADPDNAPEAEYELMIERIPYPVEGYRFEDEHKHLKIYEAGNGFYITYKNGDVDETRGMGDGVDQDFYPGMLKEQYTAMLEAYFPEMLLRCDMCRWGTINGVFVHEKHCPNERRTFFPGRGWVMMIECYNCGQEVEEGEECTCLTEDEDGTELVERG